MIKKILKWGLVVVLVLVLAASGGSYYMVQRSLAVTSGTITTGVEKPVKIVRDDYGVPHIYAESEHDMFFAQGYAHAQDRLWQMELSRRNVSGRIAELMGKDFVKLDTFNRALGFKRVADESVSKIDPKTLEALQAYADGVNAYLEDENTKLPIEYTLVGFEPEKWTPADSLAIGKYMAWELGTNMRTELFMGLLIPHLGEEKARSLIYEYDEAAPTIVKQNEMIKPVTSPSRGTDLKSAMSESIVSELFSVLDKELHKGLVEQGIGSNNWAISGKKTASGKPILSSDMHLSFGAPAMFVQNHLVTPGIYNVTGAIFPGVPGIIVGHNEKIAWGFTNLVPDVQDVYMEKVNPNNPRQFEYNGKWEDAKVVPETIKVKDQAEPVKVDTLITRHGPIISHTIDVMTEEDKALGSATLKTAKEYPYQLALRWTAHDISEEITAMLEFDRAQNYQQFEAAMKKFKAPAQNAVYADVDGNIAYHAMGAIPIRKKGDGMAPVPGWTDEYEWKGYIPWEELPHTLNPEKGYIASANNKLITDDYPYHISYEFDMPHRITRITQMLEEKDNFTLEDVQRMQNDWTNLQAKTNAKTILPALEKATDLTDAEKETLATMKEWLKNPVDDPELSGPVIYHSMYNKMFVRFFQPHMGGEGDIYYYHFIRTGLPSSALDAALKEGTPKWFEGTDDTREKAIVDSFKQAVAWMEEELGKDQKDWKWGDIHTITFNHTLGSIKPLNLIFNNGPYPYGGSNATVGMAGFARSRPFGAILGAPWRFMVDMGDVNNAKDILSMGASGQVGSDHYKDQTELWLTGKYKNMYYTQDEVLKKGEQTLILQP